MTPKSSDYIADVVREAVSKEGSISALARKVGVSRPSVHAYAHGRAVPPADTWLAILEIAGGSVLHHGAGSSADQEEDVMLRVLREQRQEIKRLRSVIEAVRGSLDG